MNGIDPRLNCAAEICCPPEAALETTATILHELMDAVSFGGVTDQSTPESKEGRHRLCIRMATAMKERGVCLMPLHLANVISEMVDHPSRGRGGRSVTIDP